MLFNVVSEEVGYHGFSHLDISVSKKFSLNLHQITFQSQNLLFTQKIANERSSCTILIKLLRLVLYVLKFLSTILLSFLL